MSTLIPKRKVGDRVSCWVAGVVELEGTVTAVEDFYTEVGPNQKVTVKWDKPEPSVEYGQDLEGPDDEERST